MLLVTWKNGSCRERLMERVRRLDRPSVYAARQAAANGANAEDGLRSDVGLAPCAWVTFGPSRAGTSVRGVDGTTSFSSTRHVSPQLGQ